jgi:hypothetical protein
MGGEVPDDRKRPTRSTKRNKAPSRCKIFELWGQPRGLQSREMESQKVEQNNGYIIEDMNAAAVVYANYSKSRSNARDA